MFNSGLGFRLIEIFSWALIAMGLIKVIFYIVGEVFPGAYRKVKSDKVRKFMTGTGNRLLFGLGGVLTVLIGAIFLLLGRFLAAVFVRGGF